MLENIVSLKAEVDAFSFNSSEDVEAFRLQYLSKKGKISQLLAQIGSVPKEDRAAFGKESNLLKQYALEVFNIKKHHFEAGLKKNLSAKDDITLPVIPSALGTKHPISVMLDELKFVFAQMGFTVADGPEVEDDFHNFSALNFPPEHPARDMQDTFFVKKNEDNPADDLVLRTHTSPVQIRLMESTKPPIRAICPGKVYRNEAITGKSYCLFHQVEGLYVNKGVNFGELKETLIACARLIFGAKVKYRMRPSFFPFTEPSLEMDVWRETSKGGEWMEILGAGMVDPNVFEAVGLDSELYTGFAFGMGVERMAMKKYAIEDIRQLYDNDLRLLKQFA